MENNTVSDGNLEDEYLYKNRYEIKFDVKETEHLEKEARASLAKLKKDNLQKMRSVKNRATSMDYFDRFMYDPAERIKEIEALKKKGTKVIGYFCVMVPEEIILAAGAVPIRLCGGFFDAIYPAEEFMPKNICPMVKATFGSWLLDMNPYFKLCDVVIIPTTCDSKKKLASILADFMKVILLDVPNTKDNPQSDEFWLSQTKLLTKKMEELTGNTIRTEKLKQAIETQNQRTKVLRRLMEVRKSQSHVINERDFLLAVQTAFYDDPNRWVEKANLLANELADNLQKGKTIAGPDTCRVMLTGSPMIWPNFKVLNIVEELSAVHVIDDSCAGVQMMYNPIEVEDWTRKGMMQAIAEKAILPCVCPCFSHSDDRIDRILELSASFRAEGVIYHVLRLCQIYDMEFLPIEKILNDRNIPLLKIETDYSEEDVGQIKTRVEAFLEMLKARRIR
ncbi:MAG: double-cubane-cluster-containing anaerobic reductase [Candidatus Woesearchaeota archaeon]